MRILSCALSMGLLLGSAAFSEDNLPRGLGLHSLTETEIAEKCKASILAKIDMVKTEDAEGNSEMVPRCVMLYRTASASANSYLEESRAAIAEISNTNASCDADATQKGCLDAGKKLVEAASNTHKRLAKKAGEIEEKLNELELPEVAEEDTEQPES